MNILCLTPVYPSKASPTEGLFNEEHARALRATGANVTMAVTKQWLPAALARRSKTYRALAELPERESRNGVDILYCRYLHLPRYHQPDFTASACARAVLKSLKRHRLPLPDVIQVHSAWPTGMAAVAVAKRLRRPFVVTFHIEDDPRLTERSGPQGLYRAMLREAAALVVVGRPLERALQNLAPEVVASKIVRIANGADLVEARAAVEEVGAPQGEWGHLVSVSNLWPTKGIHLNLEALARLSERGVPWRSYTVVGDGPERPRLEAQTQQLGIAEKVKFTGQLHHPEALRRVARADVFSLPSWQESFGIAYVEAMACGKPVVGVLGQGAEDIFRQGKEGILVPPQDVGRLAEALEKLFTDRDLGRQLGEAGARRAQRFTWENNVREYLDLYQRIS